MDNIKDLETIISEKNIDITAGCNDNKDSISYNQTNLQILKEEDSGKIFSLVRLPELTEEELNNLTPEETETRNKLQKITDFANSRFLSEYYDPKNETPVFHRTKDGKNYGYINRMNARALQFAEYQVTFPLANYEQAAADLGISYGTLLKYAASPCYKEYLAMRCKETWAGLVPLAINAMSNLIKDNDFRASQWCLATNEYTTKKVVDLNGNLDIVKISVSEDDLEDQE